MNKVIIFDASTLISLTMNGLLPELKELKKIFKGKFIIPKDVEREVIGHPITVRRFELEALKLQQLLNEKVLELPSAIGVDDEEIVKGSKELLERANKTFYGNGKDIHLIDLGEASCLALSRILDKKKIENVIAVDERTTRMLSEKPENLKKLLQKKLHMKITPNRKNYEFFKYFKFIRSAELVYVLYKKDLSRWKDSRVLDAMLWAVKFKGCAISEKEIQEIKSLA